MRLSPKKISNNNSKQILYLSMWSLTMVKHVVKQFQYSLIQQRTPHLAPYSPEKAKK